MNNAVIYDGRNCYDIEETKEYNIDYYSIGRKEVLGRELVAENII